MYICVFERANCQRAMMIYYYISVNIIRFGNYYQQSYASRMNNVISIESYKRAHTCALR